MTDDERVELVERMVLAGINARRALVKAPPLERLLQENETEAAAMRAALSVAERVVRADERGACIAVARDAPLPQTPNGIRAAVVDAIRARSAAAGEATP